MEQRACRICSDRSDGAHFGVESCRACAAFFRRSIAMRKKYVCRQGTNSCDINKSLRCICRKCRLQKCMNVGMLPEGVQNKRDPIIPRFCEKVEPAKYEDTAAQNPSENESVQRSSSSAFQLVSQSPTTRVFPNEDPVAHSPPEIPYLLARISQNYRQLCAVRRSTELSMNGSTMRSMFDGSTRGSLQDLVLGTSSRVLSITRAQVPAVADFVNTTFDEFALLTQEEKWNVFQSFIIMLWNMDSAYRTYRLVPPDLYSTMNIITETTYMDTNNLSGFFIDAPPSKVSREDLTKMLKECMNDRERMNTLSVMQNLKLTDVEYAALLALALWNPNIKNATKTIQTVAQDARAKIFRQLHLLYRMNNSDDHSMRFGELMILNGAFQVSCCKFREDIVLFNLFDLFEDTFIYDLVKR